MYYIYKKTHNLTGLKYLGYTKKDPYKYKGSGVLWLKHLKKYGFDITTEILKECKDKKEVNVWGVYFSDFYDVVKSREWANMKKEECDGGDMRGSKKWLESRKSEEFLEKQRKAATGNTNVKGYKWWYNIITGEKRRCIEQPGDEWINKFMPTNENTKNKLSNTLKGKIKTEKHKKSLSEAAKNRPSNAKGTIWVKNNEGKRKRVKPDNIPEGFKKV